MTKVEILIFGALPPCALCLQAEKIAREAAALYPEGLVSVAKFYGFSEPAAKYQISVTPTTVINGEKAAVGKMLSPEELRARIDRLIGDDAG